MCTRPPPPQWAFSWWCSGQPIFLSHAWWCATSLSSPLPFSPLSPCCVSGSPLPPSVLVCVGAYASTSLPLSHSLSVMSLSYSLCVCFCMCVPSHVCVGRVCMCVWGGVYANGCGTLTRAGGRLMAHQLSPISHYLYTVL